MNIPQVQSAHQRAHQLLHQLGAEDLDHPAGTLLDHLERVEGLLRDWGASEIVRLAGLCHAVYDSAADSDAMLPLVARSEVVEAIGRRAEALVYLYASCDRDDLFERLREGGRPPQLRNKFTGRRRRTSDTALRAVLEIDAAKELDVLRHGAEPGQRDEVDALWFVARGAGLLSPAACRAWDLATDHPARTVTIARLDHLVLTVADPMRTVDFYERVLGMHPITFGDGRLALTFGDSKINLHQVGHEIRPHARRPVSGSADLCLVTEADVVEIVEHLDACGINIEEGPVQRTGALGPVTSCYLRDPDDNLLEISTYRR